MEYASANDLIDPFTARASNKHFKQNLESILTKMSLSVLDQIPKMDKKQNPRKLVD